MIAEHFVAAHQQVGDFEVVNVNGNLRKNGGNVASYFCTPQGRVVHCVAGPVSADELLLEAKWALEQYESVKDQSLHAQARHLAQAHLIASAEGGGQNGPPHSWRSGGTRNQRVHLLLAEAGLPFLDAVYGEIFSVILGEKLSTAANDLEVADRLLTMAKTKQLPLLFVFHKDHGNSSGMVSWLDFQAKARHAGLPLRVLLQDYVVVLLPLREAPALSRRLGLPPFEFTSSAPLLFVVSRGDGVQIGSAAGWEQARQLTYELAKGWIDALKRRPPPLRRLREVSRFIRKLDAQLSRELIELIKQRQDTVAQRANSRDLSDELLLHENGKAEL